MFISWSLSKFVEIKITSVILCLNVSWSLGMSHWIYPMYVEKITIELGKKKFSIIKLDFVTEEMIYCKIKITVKSRCEYCVSLNGYMSSINLSI